MISGYKAVQHITFFSFIAVSVESVGALPPDVLFVEAIKVLKKKCVTFLEELNEAAGDK